MFVMPEVCVGGGALLFDLQNSRVTSRKIDLRYGLKPFHQFISQVPQLQKGYERA